MFYVTDGVSADEVHVAPNGEDREGCGRTPETPCMTLTHALNSVQDGDIVTVNAVASGRDPTFYCHEEPLLVNSSIVIRGVGGSAVVGCPTAAEAPRNNSTRNLMFNITGTGRENHTMVSFYNMTFTSNVFEVFNSHVTFEDCTMIDSKWNSPLASPYIGVDIYTSQWQGSVDENCTSQCAPTGHLQIYGTILYVTYEDTKFYHTKQQVTAGKYCEFYIRGSHFSNMPHMAVVHGGIYLTINDKHSLSVVRVYDSVFEDQIYSDPIQSIMNLYESALLVRAVDPPRSKHIASRVTVVASNTKFFNNERGLTFIGPFDYVNVTSCEFVDNIAMHAGAGILYLTDVKTPSYVTNCTFQTNAAGSYRPDKVIAYEDAFQVSVDEVRIHSNCCKGVISFVGKGGAIRVQRGNLTLIDCSFRNNTARLLGGAVFVDRESSLYVENILFENSPIDHHALQGDLIYSNGQVTIKSARLSVLTAKNHVAVVRHSGDHWSIEVTDVSIQCPIGYRLRVTNTSAYGVTPIGLRRSYKLDQLSYFCESCPRNKYSLDYGYLNYSLVYSAFAYYTLLIDGNKPQQAYNGTYVYHDIECKQCPYGGKCQQGITAVPNFWGYIDYKEQQVRFQHCPKGYCCSSTNCQGFSDCARNRAGPLCGKCISGYSEALFSSVCVPDEQCDSTWLYPVAICSGFLYALFLLFQKDIRDFMFLNTIRMSDIPILQRRSQHHHRQNSVNMHYANSNHVDGMVREQAELENLNTKLEDVENEPNGDVIEDHSASNNNEKDREDDDEEEGGGNAPPADTGASFLIILFYYFQDAQLLHIKTVFASTENKSRSMLKEILGGLFKFRVELFQFMDKLCFLEGIAPSTKLLVKVLLVPYVLFQFIVVWVIYNWVTKIRGKNRDDDSQKFSSRLATGFVLALLFTYQKLATTSFTLLNCVPVGGNHVLFIEGQIICYEAWQYGVMAYAGVCIVPFCLVLLIGPGLLKDGLISLPHFFCACLLPLPILLYWVTLRLRLRGQRPANQSELSSECQAVINILQGPFKDAETKLFGPTCGQGVLIGRRLILVLLFTFVNDTLIRMLCMMLVCFIILLHHVHVLPYKDTRGNIAGSASAAALVIVGGINLVRAGFEAAEYVPQGPNSMLMQVFEHVENTLMLWLPACVMALVLLLLFLKLTVSGMNYLVGSNTTQRSESPNTVSDSIAL